MSTVETKWLNRTVVGAGITSALGDFCYETTTVILPGLLSALGTSAEFLGLIEGIADAVAAFAKIFSSYIADRIGHRKTLVLLGYSLTPIGQIIIATALGWPSILFARAISWLGKGIRGPLRDAIVIQAISGEMRGRAFGFHRAADTVGAIVGPLLGVFLLGWGQRHFRGNAITPFHFALWISAIPGLFAILSFLLLVDDPHKSSTPRLQLLRSIRTLPAPFRRYLVASGLFGLGDFSHSILILAATAVLTPTFGVLKAAQTAGLLYVWRNIVQFCASYPIGFIADRLSHRIVLFLGYALGTITAAAIALGFWCGWHNVWFLGGLFFLAGLYIAVQETLESTVAAEIVDREMLVLSYGVLGTINGFTRFISSALLGILWANFSPTLGFGTSALFMLLGTIALVLI